MKTPAEQIAALKEGAKMYKIKAKVYEIKAVDLLAKVRQIEEEITKIKKSQETPQFGDIVEWINHCGERRRRVILYDSSGKLKAFNRSGEINGTPDYYRCIGVNIFTTLQNFIDQ